MFGRLFCDSGGGNSWWYADGVGGCPVIWYDGAGGYPITCGISPDDVGDILDE